MQQCDTCRKALLPCLCASSAPAVSHCSLLQDGAGGHHARPMHKQGRHFFPGYANVYDCACP